MINGAIVFRSASKIPDLCNQKRGDEWRGAVRYLAHFRPPVSPKDETNDPEQATARIRGAPIMLPRAPTRALRRTRPLRSKPVTWLCPAMIKLSSDQSIHGLAGTRQKKGLRNVDDPGHQPRRRAFPTGFDLRRLLSNRRTYSRPP